MRSRVPRAFHEGSGGQWALGGASRRQPSRRSRSGRSRALSGDGSEEQRQIRAPRRIAVVGHGAPRQRPRPAPARRRNCQSRRGSRVGRDRGPAAAAPPLARRERSPFVGREESLGWLHSEWSESRRGAGRLGVIAGDPGIGKTRLASELARGSCGGRGGVARPLSRGALDLLSAVRRRSVATPRRFRRRCCAANSAPTETSCPGSFPTHRATP
jgi:hypothetical protein